MCFHENSGLNAQRNIPYCLFVLGFNPLLLSQRKQLWPIQLGTWKHIAHDSPRLVVD